MDLKNRDKSAISIQGHWPGFGRVVEVNGDDRFPYNGESKGWGALQSEAPGGKDTQQALYSGFKLEGKGEIMKCRITNIDGVYIG